MKNNDPAEIWEKIKESDNILISLHFGPDGDSLGSCSAMKYAIERDLGKSVRLISADDLDGKLKKLSCAKEVEFGFDISEMDLGGYDLLIALDTSEPCMIGKYKQDYKIPAGLFCINIDHHTSNTYYGNMNYVNPAPSACSIVLEIFQNLEVEFDKELSTRLLLGICTDSGFFRNQMDLRRALNEALFLIDHGADYYNDVVDPILNHQSLKTKSYHSLLIKNLKINKEKNFAYSMIGAKEIMELDMNMAEIRSGIGAIGDLEGIDFSFILCEIKDGVKISFKSTKRVDVSLIAKEIGGGGHKPRAGAYLFNTSLKEAEKRVLDAIEKVGIQRF